MLNFYYEDSNNLAEIFDLNEISKILDTEEKISLISVISPNEEELNFLIEKLQLHMITIKNFSSKKHFPKIEEFDNYISLIMYDIELNNEENCYDSVPINIILMENLTLILCETEFIALNEILIRIKSNPEYNFSNACSLYYTALDVLVDNLFPILDCFENKLDELQINILNENGEDYTKKLIILRNNLLKLKKAFTYEQEVLFKVSQEKFKLICDDEIEYLKDVFHHIEKLNATLQEYNELASNLSDAYSNLASSKLNKKLQILTVIQYIFMPLAFLTDWYGMNFKMPETYPAAAYYIFMGIVSVIAISMIIYFKNKKML